VGGHGGDRHVGIPDSGSRVLLPALALSLGTAAAVGLARFAYALLLPAMKADLEWSYALAGGMNAANAAGYLLGAIVAAPVMARVGTKRAFVGTLLLTALSLLFSGVPSGYFALAALRFVSGASGAVVFIAGGVLASHLASAKPDELGESRAAGTALAVYFSGGGLGILVSGLSVPALLELGPAGA
jgi:predicted MFS family arabinose efflux permease